MYSKKKKSSDLNDPNIWYDSDHEPSRGGGEKDSLWGDGDGEKDSLWGEDGEDPPLKKEETEDEEKEEGGDGKESPLMKEEKEEGGGEEYLPRKEEEGGGGEEYPPRKEEEEKEDGGGEEYPPRKEEKEEEGGDPKNIGMDQLDIINLLEYLKKYRIIVVELYTYDNRYTMAKCITHFGNISFISIPSRYQINYAKNIKVPTVKMKTITQFDINVVDTFTTQPTININNDNIQDLLKYRGCVVTDSNIKLKRSIVNITGQLARLKPCTEYLEYKLCIKFEEYFFVIDESNNLQSYSTSDYSSNRCLYPIITLNSVMSKLKASDSIVDVLHSDISNIFDSLLSILNQTNREHLKKMEQEFKDQEIIRDINIVYDKGYLQDLLSTKQFLSEIIKSEDLSKKNLNRVSGDSTRQFKISQLKKSTYTLLIDIYNRFWNQILLIDEICFCYIQSLYLIKEQHKELKNHIHR